MLKMGKTLVARVEALKTDRLCVMEGSIKKQSSQPCREGSSPHPEGQGRHTLAQLQLDLLLCKVLPHPNNVPPSTS